MSNQRVVSKIFYFVATALVLVGTYATLSKERLAATLVRPLAVVEQRYGTVLARTEGSQNWRETIEHQSLIDGQSVATGTDSGATFSLGTGRSLTLGSDAQVRLREIYTASKSHIFVYLVRGAVVGKVASDCQACLPLALRSGTLSIDVLPGDAVGVYRPAGSANGQRFSPNGPWPSPTHATATGAVSVELVRALRAGSDGTSSEGRAGQPPLGRSPRANATQGYEVAVAPPRGGLVYTTTTPLAMLSGQFIEIPIEMPSAATLPFGWRPALEISSNNAGKIHKDIIVGRASSDKTVKLPLTKLRAIAAVIAHGALKDYTLSIRGGARMQNQGEAVYSFSAPAVPLHCLALGDVDAGGVVVSLDQAVPSLDVTVSPWLAPKMELQEGDAGVVIDLAEGADYPRLLPLVRGAHAVGLATHENGSGLSGEGIFVVRDQGVIAALRGRHLDTGAMHSILNELGADFIYKGPLTALYESRGQSSAARAEWINNLIGRGQVVYVRKQARLIAVGIGKLRSKTEASQLLGNTAHAIFTQRVEILESR